MKTIPAPAPRKGVSTTQRSFFLSASSLGVLGLLTLLSLSGLPAQTPGQLADRDGRALRDLEGALEELRVSLEIPSLSTGVVRDGELIWSRGFGMADPAKGIRATPDTPYHLASLTKTFASAVLLNLIVEEMIGLDDPVSEYGIEIAGRDDIRVKHLFTHTSDSSPAGSHYQYNGSRFGLLDEVISTACGASFREVLQEMILDPLELTSTVPGNAAREFPEVFATLAKPYAYDESHEMAEGTYPVHFSSAAGLISTVIDVAKFAIALEKGEVVPPEALAMAFTPTRSNDGETLPYGLGWFTQEYHGIRLIWHYGYWNCNSSLILTLPDSRLTFIALANTDGLSAPFRLGSPDALVLESPLALAFMNSFALDEVFPEGIPEIDWSAKTDVIVERLNGVTDEDLRELFRMELRGQWGMANYVRDVPRARRYKEILTGFSR